MRPPQSRFALLAGGSIYRFAPLARLSLAVRGVASLRSLALGHPVSSEAS